MTTGTLPLTRRCPRTPLRVASVAALALTVTACSASVPGAAPDAPATLAAGAGTDGSLPAAATSTGQTRRAAPDQPNIVFYLVDDLGYGDTGMARPDHTNPRGSSPVMDRLAATGTTFPNGYASPNCAPSRASLLTGTQGTDVDNNVYAVHHLNRGGRKALLQGPEQGHDGDDVLGTGAVTIARTLGRAGYTTGAIGKFHVASEAAQITRDFGFDVNVGGNESGNPGSYHALDGQFGWTIGPELDAHAQNYTASYVAENIVPFSNGTDPAAMDALVGRPKNVLDAVADASEKFIDTAAAKQKPFFAHIGTYGVHAPIRADQARYDLALKHGAFWNGRAGRNTWTRRSYEAIVEGTDQALGRIVRHLETTPDPRNPGHPLSDNTIVVVTSDNGGVASMSADNGGLRNQKSSTFEGGIRVPWVVWSGNKSLVPAGQRNTTLVNTTDLYPTLAQVGRATPERPDRIDGVSWWPSVARGELRRLQGADRIRAARVVHFPGYVAHTGTTPATVLREGRWKLTYYYDTGRWTLHDMARDPGEKHDLARRKRARVRRLGKVLIGWAALHRAPLPTLKRAGARWQADDFRGLAWFGTGPAKVVRQPRTVTVRRGDRVPVLLPSRKARWRAVEVTRGAKGRKGAGRRPR